MAYKYTKGSQVIGDLKAADDAERNTLIDFGEDQIEFQTSGSTRLKVNNEGTEIKNALTVGPQGRSLRISGSAFLSSSTDIYSGNGSGNYSVTLWFKSAAQVDDNRIIFTLANSNARSTVREKGGWLQFLASADDNSTCVSAINYYPAEDNNWNFLTFVTRQNGSDIETTASLNGAITDSDSVAGKTGIMNYGNGSVRKLQIGGFTADSDTIANEIFIRDFILWNGSLSTSNITTLYNNGNYYDFNNFTTHEKLVWIKNNDPIGTSYNESTTIENFGISGSNFEIAGYDIGEIVEISSDAPFTHEHLLETDHTNNHDVNINGKLISETLHVSGSVTIENDLNVNMNILDYENKSFIKNIDTGGFLASAPNTNTLRLPNDTTSESTTGVNYNTMFVCPFSGSVDKLVIRSSNDALGGSLVDLGDLTASVQIGFSGKDGYLIDSNPDAVEEVAIANAQLAANTNIVFNFTGSNFSPSDVFSVSLKPSNNWNNNGNKYINFTIVSSYLLD